MSRHITPAARRRFEPLTLIVEREEDAGSGLDEELRRDEAPGRPTQTRQRQPVARRADEDDAPRVSGRPSLAQPCGIASFASRSARSFSECPACPLPPCHSIECRAAARSNSRQRSAFFTGLVSAVSRPPPFQAPIHSVMPFIR